MVVLAPSATLLLLGLSLLGLLPASRGNTCNQLADERYVRCGANPLQRAGQYHSDERLYEISIGDPDVQYDAVSRQWHAWWSTGLASSYTAAKQAMGIKHAVSADGVRFEPTLAPVLRTAASPTAWDHSKAETPTVVRLPPAIRTPKRQWLMLYSGGNDGAPRPAGITYTWYQIGAAFSADGESFTKISAAESPYAGKATPYSGSIEGLALLGRDAFPGVAGVADGLVADPELVVDPDGTKLHLFFSSEAIDSRGTPLKYGVSHATSQDGVHWVVSPGNPVRATPPLSWATRTVTDAIDPTHAGDQRRLWTIGGARNVSRLPTLLSAGQRPGQGQDPDHLQPRARCMGSQRQQPRWAVAAQRQRPGSRRPRSLVGRVGPDGRPRLDRDRRHGLERARRRAALVLRGL